MPSKIFQAIGSRARRIGSCCLALGSFVWFVTMFCLQDWQIFRKELHDISARPGNSYSMKSESFSMRTLSRPQLLLSGLENWPEM